MTSWNNIRKLSKLFHKWNSIEAFIINPTVQIKVLQFEKKIDKNLKRPLNWKILQNDIFLQ